MLHRRALAALADPALGAPDYVRLAHHAEAAGDGPAVLRYARAAGERAAERGSPREAQHHYWRALRFAEGIDPEARAELLERFCDHAYVSDMRAEAVGAIDEAIAIHRRNGDSVREGHALKMRARLLGCIGRAREAGDTIRDAVRVLEQGPPGAELARACAYLAGIVTLDNDLPQAIMMGAKAISIAEQADDVEGLVYALNNVGTAEMTAGDPGGQAKLERSLELARQAHLGTDAGRAYINLSCRLIHHARWREALAWIERGIEYTRELGLEAWFKCLVSERAVVELALGRWEDATATAQALLDGPRDQIIEPRTNALTVLGLARARRGDPGCWPLLDEAWERAAGSNDLEFLGPVSAARAEAAWVEGRAEAIGAETETTYDLACRLNEPTTAGWLAVWRARAGLPVEPPDNVPERFRLQLDGEPEAAAELLRAEGADYEAAIALASSSDGSALRAAHEQLHQLGAKPGAAILARRLRELGERNVPRGPRGATRENPAGLTNRELEVLPLLAQGLRNADIAKRLVVTPKTVDHHVSSILRKLGVANRGQASAAAAQLGVVAGEAPPGPTAK
jgi:DNA-binding CsgD family transcriptional regulator